ncbi:MAG: hypothetical protein COC06_11425 [Bacteroidales bacterium]|nr:MAG: hypothetical protein COC06_11425 [Bacteroidales bacterium]
MSKILEIAQANIEYKKARNTARKKLNKLKIAKEKYYFLDRIIEPRKDTDTRDNDIELEYAILNLFKSIGFKCEKPKLNADVDVKVKFKDFYFGVEVKNGGLVGENDTFQPFKHKLLNDDSFHPLLVFNNTKYNNNWDAPRIKIATKAKFGLLLTTELKDGYIKLKNNKITFDQFLNQLRQTGEIKFSNRAIQRAYKSEGDR